MTKLELVHTLAARFSSNMTTKQCNLGVNLILDSMLTALARHNRIEIRGFGTFALNYRPSRMGRNPKSGERVHVPAKYVPHFRAGKDLRQKLNGQSIDISVIKEEIEMAE